MEEVELEGLMNDCDYDDDDEGTSLLGRRSCPRRKDSSNTDTDNLYSELNRPAKRKRKKKTMPSIRHRYDYCPANGFRSDNWLFFSFTITAPFKIYILFIPH